jgi:hypothetical protein
MPISYLFKPDLSDERTPVRATTHLTIFRLSYRQMRSPWHSVSIVTTPASCHTARALRGVRFLSAEAPRLPLPTCSADRMCPCAYKHHDDRRGKPRRTDELTGFRRPIAGSAERRQQRGRRSTDF